MFVLPLRMHYVTNHLHLLPLTEEGEGMLGAGKQIMLGGKKSPWSLISWNGTKEEKLHQEIRLNETSCNLTVWIHAVESIHAQMIDVHTV